MDEKTKKLDLIEDLNLSETKEITKKINSLDDLKDIENEEVTEEFNINDKEREELLEKEVSEETNLNETKEVSTTNNVKEKQSNKTNNIAYENDKKEEPPEKSKKDKAKNNKKKSKKPLIISIVVIFVIILIIVVLLFLNNNKSIDNRSKYYKAIENSLDSGKLSDTFDYVLKKLKVDATHAKLLAIDIDSDKSLDLVAYIENKNQNYILNFEVDDGVYYEENYEISEIKNFGYAYSYIDNNLYWFTINNHEYTVISNGKKIMSKEEFEENYYIVTEKYEKKEILANSVEYDLDKELNIDLLDILTYGVSWKPNVADPDLTRIGNPILHRTLPIQSGIKGCIAQCKTDSGKPKIMYWLDENDWRFRKIPEILYGQELIVSNDVYTIVNSVFSTNRYLKQYIKVNNVIAQVTEIDTETTTATIVLDSVVEAGTYNVELGAVLNGYDGEVKNYVPKFYYKSYDGSDERWVRISQFQIDNSWVESKANLVSVCNPTILRSVPSDMGYLSTLESGAIVCIFNDNAYCRGGDNSSTYDLNTDIFRRNLGKPVTSMTRASMRNACKKSGNHITSYNEYKAIFYWLFVIEYATFNCQKSFNQELTSEGYH